MFDDQDGTVDVFDFEELANLLLEQGADASPSGLHGCLTGLLAAGAPREPEFGLDALGQALHLNPHGELANQLLQLYSITAEALADDEFTFLPLLPEDDAPIDERTRALADWCTGFLAGFAYAGAGVGSSGGMLSEDGTEILRDFAAFSVAVVEDEEDTEELERSYMELSEYMRFAVLNLFLECNVEGGSAPTPVHQLH